MTQGHRLNNFSYGKAAMPCSERLQFGSWNVEGLTDIKIFQLCNIMTSRAIPLLCLQETWDGCSGSRFVHNGFTLINSGSDDGKRSFAGVGFLVAPWFRDSIYSYKLISDRICVM